MQTHTHSLTPSPGMVATLRAIGVTHVSLGNHEADLRLNKLKRRLEELAKSATIINSNIMPSEKAPWLAGHVPNHFISEYSLLETQCRSARIGLLGLMSDEPNMFRDGTFRGAPIASVTETYDRLRRQLGPDIPLVALTHQSLQRDQELAQHMAQYGDSIIMGGHEHEPHHLVVETQSDQGSAPHRVHILKAGMDASACHDITIELDGSRIAAVDARLELMSSYPPSVVVQAIVDQHQSLLTAMENEVIINAQSLLPPGVTLSSIGTRRQQTTVGAILCTAVKEQLEADVAMINGAPIKGNREYVDGKISFAELKKELPFPTKMVVVPMKRWQLHEAIHYSRKHPVNPQDGQDIERRGYLQVDLEFDRLGFHTGGQDDVLMVALPRNLLKGFCDIEPLIDFGNGLKERHEFPAEDDYVHAIDLVITHFCKETWYEIVRDNLSFDDLDLGQKGFLSREDGKLGRTLSTIVMTDLILFSVARMLKEAIGHEPAPFVIDHMIAAVDADENGVVDRGEFSFLLAQMEREHGNVFLRFD